MTEPAASVGFVGLGAMGAPMAGRLLAAGIAVRGFDLQQEAVERFAAQGGSRCRSAAEAASGSDPVLLMLPDSDAVTAVLAEIGPVLGRGALVVDMSSSEPLRTRELADELAKAGAHIVDAPVSGGVKGATAGTLSIMAGGAAGLVDRCRGLLEQLGTVRYVGPVGAGHAIKALNNLLSATHLWATSEAILAGRAFGLDPSTMLEVFNDSSGRSGSTENKWPNYILPGSFDSGFPIGLMLKDLTIASTVAHQVGQPCELGDAVAAQWARAAAGLDAKADHTEVARWLAGGGSVGADLRRSAREGDP